MFRDLSVDVGCSASPIAHCWVQAKGAPGSKYTKKSGSARQNSPAAWGGVAKLQLSAPFLIALWVPDVRFFPSDVSNFHLPNSGARDGVGGGGWGGCLCGGRGRYSGAEKIHEFGAYPPKYGGPLAGVTNF